MDDLYNRIVADRGSLENLMGKIPGFRGYQEMAARREADRMMRAHVAQQYEQQLTRFNTVQQAMVRGGGLMLMDQAKSIHSRLEHLRRRIASDTPGYSGFFATNKIDSETLQNVYAFDEAMLGYVDRISAALDTLDGAISGSEGIEDALKAVDSVLREAHQAYDLRDGVLTGIQA